MKYLKHLLLGVAMLGVMALFAGCSNGDDTPQGGAAPADGGLEAVELIVYFLGDGAVDNNDVFALINEKTAELINTTISPLFISWADFDTRYPLVFASGEYFDLIYTSSWSFYADQAIRGGFYNLTDEMLNRYAPELMAMMPEAALREARINGNVYMLPNINDEWNHLGLLIRGDLRQAHNLPEITNLETLELYLRTIAEHETHMIPFDGGSDFDAWVVPTLWLYQPQGWVAPDSLPGYAYSLTDYTGTLFNMFETPEYQAFLTQMREFNELGFWSRNALNNTIRSTDSFLAGRSGMAVHNIGTIASIWNEVLLNHPEWEPEVIDSMFNEFPTIRTSFLGNGFGVRAISNHPERAVMYINLIRTNQELYDLMMLGIEGRHWVDAGPGLAGAGPNYGDFGGFSNWGFITQPLRRFSLDEWPGMEAVRRSYESRVVSNPAFYFLFDESDIRTEAASMSQIVERYFRMLDFGFDPDWENTIVSVSQQLDNAGRQQVLDEYRSQIVGFIEEFTR
ncbi:MAG: ABC transporter substrate-binding protein [Defluviitaleaceae bacterium]|nr:ABC transporter substrate-binding protein [Defluviitaleaceae bacterium]